MAGAALSWPGDVRGANGQMTYNHRLALSMGVRPPARVLRQPHAPTPAQLLATFSGAWANVRGPGALCHGPGNSPGVARGAARVDLSQAGLGGRLPSLAHASPLGGHPGSGSGWHPGRGGSRAGGFVCCTPHPFLGPHPTDPVRALESETKAREALGGLEPRQEMGV